MRKGFTLIELAIVLAIIGLMTGGVLAGQSLITQTRLRKQISQFEEFERARVTFFSKFGQNPGDFGRAQTFWSTAVSGNGNGYVEDTEGLEFWKQLYLAGILLEDYQGDMGGGEYDVYPGENVPKATYEDNGCMTMREMIITNSSNEINTYDYYWLAKMYEDSGVHYCSDYFLEPSEAYYIDAKMDDGKPLKGKVVMDGGFYDISSTCYDLLSGPEEAIFMTNTDKSCVLTRVYTQKGF